MMGVRFLFHLAGCDWRRSVQVAFTQNAYSSIAYKLFTKSAQSSGPENIRYKRPLPGLLAPGSVLSPSRITLENNGKSGLGRIGRNVPQGQVAEEVGFRFPCCWNATYRQSVKIAKSLNVLH